MNIVKEIEALEKKWRTDADKNLVDAEDSRYFGDYRSEAAHQAEHRVNHDHIQKLAALRAKVEGGTEIETMQRNAELWQKHGPAIQQMLAALDILSPLVLTRLKLQDAAMNGATELKHVRKGQQSAES